MASRRPARLPLWMVLVLVLCLSAMAVHLYVESLSLSGLPASYAMNECTGHCDDHFIPVIDNFLPVDERVTILTPESSLLWGSFSVPPLLPPPDR